MRYKALVAVLTVMMFGGVAYGDTFTDLTVNGTSQLQGNVNVVNNANLKVVGGVFSVQNPANSSEKFTAKFNGMAFFRPAGAFFDNRSIGADTVFRTSEIGDRDHTPLRLKDTGEAVVEVLEITGGSDLSETFDVAARGNQAVEAGTVVSIDPASPGKLMVSHTAYDKKVVGIISGAGGLQTGMLMGQTGSLADGAHPVALTGRVYCKVDATLAAIEPGDLLTTSATPGHAMKVLAHDEAMGAVIGKAMTPLAQGRKGLVLVLVTLQ